jgi:YebC/PmpR family DNA-binding regulatory protein
MSGHSKWSTIKRKKAANDARRGNVFTRLAREIAIAAREGGGDPESNFALRLAMDKARASNMPKENVERAIRRGTGEDKEGATWEQIAYEGFAPHGVALMIEVVTDNRNRAVAEVRHALTRGGGNMADAGAVAWQFKRAAYFDIPAAGTDADKVFEAAVEAGADDVVTGGDDIEIYAPVEAFKSISDRLEAMSIKPFEAALRLIPTTAIELSPEQTLQVMRMIEGLEELDDVQQVYSTLKITDAAVALLEAA